jgi:hypothetical protein
MQTRTLTLPELGFIVATRAALGAGIGMLLGERLDLSTRRAVGFMLAGIGVITTIPAAMVLFRRRPALSYGGISQSNNLIGVRRFARRGDEA